MRSEGGRKCDLALQYIFGLKNRKLYSKYLTYEVTKMTLKYT